jgi:thiol-disulfide isomerase/thioredoxin
MKQTLIALLLLANGSLFAQKNPYGVSDDLLKDKEGTLGKFIPMDGKQYLFASYVIEPAEFIGKLDAFKKELQPSIDAESDPALKELKSKDLDYYTRNVLKHYILYYGMDSMGMVNLEKVMVAKKGAPDFSKALDSAFQKIYLKKLSKEERTKLNEKVMLGGNPSEADLFKRSAAYRQWMEEYVMVLRQTKYKSDTTLGYEGQNLVKLRVVNKEITEPFIREYLSYNLSGLVLKMVKSREAREEAYQAFMAIASNDAVKKSLKEVYDNNKMMESNAASPEFSYVSIDNKKVALKDLRGKYVYIDVWATWCGPCKAEIPHLQKVEKDYHGKNIHFVSLSVDKQADKPKWEKYVKEHNLGGIQIIADKDFESEFIKKYNIAAIPRFILIDPKGKIVSGNALRPSDPGLRDLLNKLL